MPLVMRVKKRLRLTGAMTPGAPAEGCSMGAFPRIVRVWEGYLMTDVTPFPRRLIWLVITASVLVYGALAVVLTPRLSFQDAGIPSAVLIVLAAGGCGTALLLLKVSPSGLPTPLRDLLIWASLESVAIIGLLAAWVSGRAEMFLPYGGVALVLLMVARPRE